MPKKAYIGIPTLANSLGDLEVGSTVKLNVNNTATDFLVVQQGNPDPSMYDASCDGTWLLMKDCYEQRAWNSADSNSYKASTIHNYLNSNFLSLFDANIQSVIKQVKIPYYNGVGGEGNVASGSNGLSTKVFLLSMYEVGFTTSFSGAVSIDGAKLSYFTSGSTVANYNGSASDWYLRSPYSSGSGGAWYCQTTNGNATAYGCTTSRGIRPAIILPANLSYKNGTIDGSEAGWQNVARKIKKGYLGIPKPEYEPVFADNTWSQIIKACQKNEVPSTWAVGDNKTMKIGGTDYQIDIIGKNHDTYSDDSGTAPLTFQMHDCYSNVQMNGSNDNSVGWGNSVIRVARLPEMFALMPTEVQNGIKEVNKLTSAGYASSTINTTADKLFLLSEIEVFGNITYSKSGEGTQYAYYAAGNSKIKTLNGSNKNWWTRSPRGNTQTGFCLVTTTGSADDNTAAGAAGIAPAFCFGGTSEVNNVFGGYSLARKIKKAFIGIGGLARPCWSGGELTYYGTATPMSKGKGYNRAASVGDYVIFSGGQYENYSGGNADTVEVYDKSLTRSNLATVSTIRLEPAATSLGGKYAMFAGGYNGSGGCQSIIWVYDASLTLVSAGNNLTMGHAVYRNAATSVGDYALIAGGADGRGNAKNYVNVVNTSLTRTSTTNLRSTCTSFSAATVGNYAVFHGGNSSGYVDAYDTSLSLTTAPNSTSYCWYNSGVSLGDYALFDGGEHGTFVDVYDTSLVKTNAPERSATFGNAAATAIGNYALFGGGYYNSTYYDTVDVYDNSLTKTSITGLSVPRYQFGAATVGNYALFGGGIDGDVGGHENSKVVDVYTIV